MSLAVVSPSYDQSARDLADHPVINEMAIELLAATPPMLAVLISDGHPTTRFMELANDRFVERTDGQHGRYIGSVARMVTARFLALREELTAALLAAALPDEVTEARAAELEAEQAIRDMWAYGSRRCPLTKYAESAGRAADAFNR